MNRFSQSSALKAKTSTASSSTERESGSGSTLEVVPKAKRRTFTAEYKARILREADAASRTRGGVGELLRREALFSSHLTAWRNEARKGLSTKRGRKARSAESRENEQLRRENARLAEKLRKAEIIIDVQKKVATLLGIPIATPPSEDA
jgi:transposase-like protein